MPRYSLKAFTLAELLIALGILGVIATFTIPKVLQGQQQAQKKAVFKETIATLSEIVYNGYFTGDFSRNNLNLYIFSKMNAVIICQNDANGEGCWTHTAFDPLETFEGGAKLHNGTTIAGIKPTAGSDYEEFIIDWDGPSGSNTQGDDQIKLVICWESTPCFGSIKTGTIGPEPGYPLSIALYDDIFTN